MSKLCPNSVWSFTLLYCVFCFYKGSSEYDHIRSLSFGDVAVFVVCFDVTKTATLDSIQRKVRKEIENVNISKHFWHRPQVKFTMPFVYLTK